VSVERRFAGLQRLLGAEPAERVYRAHVAVVGLGGVGLGPPRPSLAAGSRR